MVLLRKDALTTRLRLLSFTSFSSKSAIGFGAMSSGWLAGFLLLSLLLFSGLHGSMEFLCVYLETSGGVSTFM